MARRVVLEECVRISSVGIGPLVRMGVGARGATPDGDVLQVAAVGDGRVTMHAIVSVPGVGGPPRRREISVCLVRCPSAVGKRRWLWSCPRCDRRVQDLYVQRGEETVRCRACGDLAYRAQQTRRVDLKDLCLREDEVHERLRFARSPKRITSLHARARRLAEKKYRVMTGPTLELVDILGSLAGQEDRS